MKLFVISGRRIGKAAQLEKLVAEALARGERVAIASTDGLKCGNCGEHFHDCDGSCIK